MRTYRDTKLSERGLGDDLSNIGVGQRTAFGKRPECIPGLKEERVRDAPTAQQHAVAKV
jgi:hypothetical protein